MNTEGKFDQVKGRVEETVGTATDNDELKAKGNAHENQGKLKEVVADIKDKVDDMIDKVEDRLDHKSANNTSDDK